MAAVKRAHEWQAVSRKGARAMSCKRCGVERLNASGWCYEEEAPEQEETAENGDGKPQG